VRRVRADLVRWIGLWLLAVGSFVALDRSSPGAVAAFAALAIGAILSGLALGRRRRAVALGLPALALAALALGYALRPADASAVFSIALVGAAQLAALVAVQALAWRSAWGRRAGRLLCATLSLTAAFLGGELVAERVWPRTPHGLRALASSPEPRPYLSDPELVHVQAPRFRGVFTHPEYDNEPFETNADGFRGAEWPDPLPPAAHGPGDDGETRVLVLGDSTTVGFGVRADEALPALLERRLAPAPGTQGRPVRVLNAGVAGYGTRQERVLLGRLLPRVAPSLVLVVFYDGNDLEDCRTQLLHAHASGASAEPVPKALEAAPDLPSAPGTGTLFGRAYWYRYSALYRRIEVSLLPFVARAGLVPPDHAYVELLSTARVDPDPAAAAELRLAIDAVRAMDAACRAAGARFALVRLPARVQTEPGSFAGLLRRYGADPAAYDRTLPGGRVLAACAESDIPALDLLPALEVTGHGPNPAYFLEGHPSREGNRAAAERIAAFLVARGLVD
jgi:GDSL-like Lipase/Acylhydrolase family